MRKQGIISNSHGLYVFLAVVAILLFGASEYVIGSETEKPHTVHINCEHTVG